MQLFIYCNIPKKINPTQTINAHTFANIAKLYWFPSKTSDTYTVLLLVLLLFTLFPFMYKKD